LIPQLVRGILWAVARKRHSAEQKEVIVYLTDIVWGGYALFVAAVALFMVVFTLKVKEKGG
jgi:hypothetical protein